MKYIIAWSLIIGICVGCVGLLANGNGPSCPLIILGRIDFHPLPKIGSQWIRKPIDEQDPFQKPDSCIYTVTDTSSRGSGYVKYEYPFFGKALSSSATKYAFYVCFSPLKQEEK
jgi:hypothetical protein